MKKKPKFKKKPKIYHPITLKNFIKDESLNQKESLVRINKQEISIKGKRLFQINNEIKIANGDKLVLFGENGSGKSVFFSTIG